MRLRPPPAAATWVLKLFCSNPEDDSLVGDLMEQYQRGHGPIWYWRQVLVIVFLGFYRKPGRVLVRTMRLGFALILLIAILLIVALLTDIWVIFLVAILAGVITGIFKFARGNGRTELTPSDAPRVARINMSKIPISGGIGAGFLIVILLTAVLHDLPMLRLLAVPGILAGLIFAVILRLWRRVHVPAPLITLGLESNAIEDMKNQSKKGAAKPPL